MMDKLLRKVQGDRVIWMVVIFLSLISLLSVYSSISTLAYKAHGNSIQFLIKHLVILILGLGTIYVLHKTKFKYFSPMAQVLFWVAVGMLLFTLLFGVERNGAKRWLNIPFINMSFQTSDFAKLVLIVITARMLNIKRTILHDFKNGVLPILWRIGLICVLILPADFSTAIMLGGMCLLLMFMGGVPLKHIMLSIGMAFGLGILILGMGKLFPDALPRIDTWYQRVEDFVQPHDDSSGNFQSDLAQFAIYDGGLFPSGPGTGTSRNYLPAPYSDMIYAFIIQEWGSILGGVGLMLLYLIFLYRTIKISLKCPKHFGGLMALGLGFMLTSQALFNMAVAVHLFPMTGQPLPLVSMGGTSIIFTCIAIGIILSVSRSLFNPEEFEKESNLNTDGNKFREEYA